MQESLSFYYIFIILNKAFIERGFVGVNVHGLELLH